MAEEGNLEDFKARASLAVGTKEETRTVAGVGRMGRKW